MKNRIALVTGGTRGIGSVICEQLLAEGATVIAADINEEQNKEWLSSHAKQWGDKVDTVVCNVSDFDSCQKMVATVKEKYKKIDILINNAGVTRDATLKKMTKIDWDTVIRVDLDSVFNVTKHVLDIMLENGYGRIINISSVNGLKGQFGQTNYAAAKAGMHGFAKSLALETASKNITVNTVSPGYIATEMVMAIPEDIRAKIVAQIPVGRLGKPEEIARLVAFLAAEASGYITGANFSINGGLYLA